jgi:hypothetical protein
MGNCLGKNSEEANSCPILVMPPMTLETIFSYLTMEDMSSLSNTCHLFHGSVVEFLRHCCCRKLRSTNVQELLHTQYEQQLVKNIQNWLVVDMMGLVMIFNLLLEKSMVRIKIEEEHVLVLEDGDCKLEADNMLRREVIRVRGAQLSTKWFTTFH